MSDSEYVHITSIRAIGASHGIAIEVYGEDRELIGQALLPPESAMALSLEMLLLVGEARKSRKLLKSGGSTES